MTKDTEIRHVVVTGGGTGIGAAVARRLAQEGWTVTLMGRRAQPLEEVRDAIRAAGGQAELQTCDVRERAEVDRAFAEARARSGPLHAVIANAGIGGANAPGPDDRFADIVQTNLVGSYWTLRAAQATMADASQGPRQMVVVSSILGRFGVPGYTGYCASKTGLFGLVRSMALELAGEEIMVNAIAPGWVNTAMARQGVQGFADALGVSYEEALAQAMSAVPLGRMSEPEHVAGMVAWLLSSDALGITGQGLDMNNGAWM